MSTVQSSRYKQDRLRKSMGRISIWVLYGRDTTYSSTMSSTSYAVGSPRARSTSFNEHKFTTMFTTRSVRLGLSLGRLAKRTQPYTVQLYENSCRMPHIHMPTNKVVRRSPRWPCSLMPHQTKHHASLPGHSASRTNDVRRQIGDARTHVAVMPVRKVGTAWGRPRPAAQLPPTSHIPPARMPSSCRPTLHSTRHTRPARGRRVGRAHGRRRRAALRGQ